ncbi:hypothetical protein [Neoroseomonas soli]|uniref:DUF4149 domain-containing protein n=1 Tax=Neoroseomonas soli TaxID=1081025 RepID=A0A9X9WUF2_9PROT|nr:hypothetical protein [Neoroseomonas soli]MBR0670781.1 hypothetical protein [Neoroseomonas soli]
MEQAGPVSPILLVLGEVALFALVALLVAAAVFLPMIMRALDTDRRSSADRFLDYVYSMDFLVRVLITLGILIFFLPQLGMK